MKLFIKRPLTAFFALLLFLTPATNLGMATPTEKLPETYTAIENLPFIIQDLIEMLNDSRLTNGYSELNCHNSLLISGPDGNGKTTYAHTIVEHTGAKLIELPGTYFTSQEYDGIDRLREVYSEIKEIAEQHKHPVILLIEDAEVITDLDTQCALWCMLDDVSDDPRILVIMTVKKHLGIFDARLSSRMLSLEVDNPTHKQRLELLQCFWKEATKNQFIDQETLQELAQISHGLSRKELKKSINSAFITAQKQGLLTPYTEELTYQILTIQRQKNLRDLKLLRDKIITKYHSYQPIIITIATIYCMTKLKNKIKSF